MAPSGIGGAHQIGAGNGNGIGGFGGAGRSSFFQRFVYGPVFGWLGFFFRYAFWPLRRISDFLLPLGEYEGMSQTSTEGASKLFTKYLEKILFVNTDAGNDIVQLFSNKSYADLQQEAASSDALIMVFLHSPYHRSTEDVCRRLLCSPSMVRFMTENKDRVKAIGSSTSTSQGASLSHSLVASSFPVLVLLQPVKRSSSSSSSNNNNNISNLGGIAPGPVKLVFKAEGPTLMKLTAMQLTTLVTATFQKHERAVLEAASRKYEQEQATTLRRQQDEEYQETLRQDQERERQRTEERLKAEKEEEERKEEEQRKVMDEANRLDRAKALHLDEPPKGTPGCARIRFRLPNGKQLDRRFGANQTIGSLKAFLVLYFADELPENEPSSSSATPKKREGTIVKRVAMSTNFPKRIYGGEGNEESDDDKTLKECDLCPQAVLMVQDLDA